MISRFFIDRPVFAIVLSLVIVLAGLVAWGTLPVAQYPEVTPPTVTVTAYYPGANAQTVRNTVAAPIEEQVSGVENMLYMSSQCTNDGTYNLTVTFRLGMDTDMAQVLVQNRVSLALPVIPALVQNEGISVKKMSPNTLMIVNLLSLDGRYDSTFLSNYATIYIKDELGRMPGVAGITYLGQRDYSLRAWLDPAKMAALNLSATDIINAISQQNLQVAAGQIGQQPVPRGQQFQLTINTLGRLVEPEQFENIILKAGTDTFQGTTAPDAGTSTSSTSGGTGSNGGMGGQGFQGGATDEGGSNSEGGGTSQATGIVRLRDVARVELGSRQYDQSCTLDGKPSVAISIYQLPGSNAMETAHGIYSKMRQLKGRFPDGLDYKIVYDTTPFIEESINEVYNTLRDAVILVGIVVLVFLQDWKAMILPMIDVPVSLIGTFAIMAALGFSLNNLTLFGLVLAIGIVVDDAIVVLENIERLIATGLDSRTATIRAMEEITGPIVAITLVLSSVFIPCCFMGGISGQFFRQFAVTIAVSTIISAINALTMTPSRAVMIFQTEAKGDHGGHELKREALPWWFFAVVGGMIGTRLGYAYAAAQLGVTAEGLEDGSISAWMSRAAWWAAFTAGAIPGGLFGLIFIRPINAVLGWLFRGFNRMFDKMTAVYGRVVGGVLRISVLVLMLYGGLLGLTYWEFISTPTGFVPQQDKGYLLLNVQLPDSASVERTVPRHGPHRVHGPRDAGRGAHRGRLGPVVTLERQRAQPGLAVCAARAVREAARPPPLGRRHRRANPGALPRGARGDRLDLRRPADRRPGHDRRLQAGHRGPRQPRAGVPATGQRRDRRAGQSDARPRGAVQQLARNTPWLYLEIDRTKCMALGVPVSELFNTLQVYLGSYYVNNFNEFGRTWQVNIQADQRFRGEPQDIRQLQVRNNRGQMIRLATLMDVRNTSGPVAVMRYNMYSSTAITGHPAPGTSSGQAIAMMQQIADQELPRSMASDWTELAFMELQQGGTAIGVFVLAVVFVFLVLAAQYESWKLPLAVILVVPMCLLCSLIGVNIAGMDVSLFTQIGFVVLVGLASKNAILIVEFAKQAQESGVPRREATLEACRLRLRPILMTSFAFIFGVVPLVIAHGAGAEMRRSLGTAVFSGMLGVTLFGVFLTPVFYYVIQRNAPAPQPAIPHEANGAASNGAVAAMVGEAPAEARH